MRQQNRISIIEAWPATMFFAEWPDQESRAPRLIQHVHDMSRGFSRSIESGVATSSKSAEGLIESPMDLFSSDEDEDMQALASWIRQSVKAAVHKANNGAVPIEKLSVKFTESWFHITNDGGFHDAHVHGNCSWCGIFCLAAGDPDIVPDDGTDKAGNGVNRFYAHIPTGGMVADYGSSYLRRSYMDVQPMNGRLVIFPSFLLHSALPYRGSTDRIVMAFNSRTDVLSV